MSAIRTAELREFCTIVQGGRLKLSGNDFVPTGYPAYGAGGMNGYLSVCEFDRSAIVLSSIGARCGKCFYADGDWTSLANTQVILPDIRRGDARFLWHQLNDEARWPRSGTAQPFIKPSDVKTHRVFLPPISEQHRIAAILDHADALRAKRRAALAELDEMAQAIFVEMFGSPLENKHGYPVKPLAEVIDPARPITYGILMPGPDHPSGVPYVRVVDMADGHVMLKSVRRTTPEIARQYERSKLRSGDLLISIRGHVGRIAITPAELDGANITQDTARLAVTRANPAFIQGVLEADCIREWMARRTKGAAVQGLNLGDLRLVPVLQPPAEVQDAYAARVTQMRLWRKHAVAQQSSIQELFAALQHRAFRGEL